MASGKGRDRAAGAAVGAAEPATDWNGVAIGLALSFLGAYHLFKLPPVLPVLLEAYAYDRTLAGGFMSIYAAAGLLLSVLFGRRITAAGSFRPSLAALAVVSLGNLLGLVAPEQPLVMLASRGLEGIGFTTLAIAGPVLANRHAAARHRPLVIGMTASWIPFGQLSAAGLATLVVDWPGWQALWLVGLALNAGMALWLLARRSQLEAEAAQGGPGAGGAGAAPARLGSGLLIMLVVTAGIFLCWSGQYFAAMTWLPQYFVEAQGLSLAWAQLSSLLPAAVLMAFNLLTGLLIGRGLPIGALLSVALASQALLWWCLPALDQAGLLFGVIALVAYGIGAGICPTCLFAMPNALMGVQSNQARAFGVIMTGRNLGVLLGPVVIAEAYKAADSWTVAAPVFGTSTLVAMVMSFGLWVGLSRMRR